jgi:lipopolysaccharide transport system permease protein
LTLPANALGSLRPRPRHTSVPLLKHLQELFRYRELIVNLVVRELKARYKNSVLGFAWSLLNPLGMMIVYTIVFTVLMPTNQVARYPIFLLCALLPWEFFSSGLLASISSIVGNAGLVKKVYFPREALPTASVLASLVNFLLALAVLFAVLVAFRATFSPWLWMLPIVIAVQTCFVLGMAFILSTLNVFYRDTMMVMDVVLRAWFFLTPVVYPIEVLPRSYHLLGFDLDVRRLMYILNPVASLTASYRDLLYWGYRPNPDFFLRTAVTALAVLALGYWFSLRYSHRFGEEV